MAESWSLSNSELQVDHPSAGWSFYWYKAVPRLSDNSYSYELLPGSENGTEQHLFIIDGQTHTAGYYCRAGRGDPVFYTSYSKPVFVWSGGQFEFIASLTVSPDSVQHFTKTSVSLSCEGNSTEWRVMRFSKPDYLYPCSSWGTMTGSTCRITNDGDIILLKTQTVYNVDFYRNNKLIQNDTRSELTISAVSKSDEGFYKCKQRDSANAASGPGKDSEFPVLLIVGLLCGVSLIILLLLFLYLYRKSKIHAIAGWYNTLFSFIMNMTAVICSFINPLHLLRVSNNVFCKDKTNGNNIPKLNLCLLNLICSFALHSSDIHP
ncbi:hypothetical protein F7725_004696 [Dissostichus mawsoni]|uniref:Ig-like domain-containing protein n=1 Tax=Dissostichus mawsoni TaxID=36200 RepID=A0A7J5XJG5_DISMA|nr:hypothetical protein F7725_004696 [Dissostichus mawsoni]